MASPNQPRLDADGIPPDMRLSAAVLQDRIEDDPTQAQRAFSILIDNPTPSETDYGYLTHEVGRQGVDAVRSFRSVILSGLLRYLSYDPTTQMLIDDDHDYRNLRSNRKAAMSGAELEKHKVRIGASELYHFAGRMATVQQEAMLVASSDNVISIEERTAS